MTQTSDDGTSVVVLGAGYAGVIAANRLWGSLTAGERARVAITLVSPTDRFVHRIRLHEHAAGVADAALPLRSMIPEAVRRNPLSRNHVTASESRAVGRW